jgi:RNA polymerase sigma factor (sigma-70 family)
MRSIGNPYPFDVDTLTADYLSLARSLARPYQRRKPWLHDDLESAACYGLFRAAQIFDPARNVKFATFARYFILGRLRQVYRRSAPALLPPYVIVAAGDRSDNIPDDPAADFERLIACVPARHREILRLIYRDGLSQVKAAQEMGESRWNVALILKESLAVIAWWHRFGPPIGAVGGRRYGSDCNGILARSRASR